MPHPPRPQLSALPEFVGTAVPRPDPAVQARVEAFVLEQYAVGRSLRDTAELTDRSLSTVRDILDNQGRGGRRGRRLVDGEVGCDTHLSVV